MKKYILPKRQFSMFRKTEQFFKYEHCITSVLMINMWLEETFYEDWEFGRLQQARKITINSK